MPVAVPSLPPDIRRWLHGIHGIHSEGNSALSPNRVVTSYTQHIRSRQKIPGFIQIFVCHISICAVMLLDSRLVFS